MPRACPAEVEESQQPCLLVRDAGAAGVCPGAQPELGCEPDHQAGWHGRCKREVPALTYVRQLRPCSSAGRGADESLVCQHGHGMICMLCRCGSQAATPHQTSGISWMGAATMTRRCSLVSNETVRLSSFGVSACSKTVCTTQPNPLICRMSMMCMHKVFACSIVCSVWHLRHSRAFVDVMRTTLPHYFAQLTDS